MTIEQIEQAAEEMMPYSKDGSSAGRSVFGKHYKRGFRAGAKYVIQRLSHIPLDKLVSELYEFIEQEENGKEND